MTAEEMATRLRILIVEDSEDDAEMVLHWLGREGIEVVSTRVQTAPDMHEALVRQQWDVVLSDYVMRTFSAAAVRAVLSTRARWSKCSSTWLDAPPVIRFREAR